MTETEEIKVDNSIIDEIILKRATYYDKQLKRNLAFQKANPQKIKVYRDRYYNKLISDPEKAQELAAKKHEYYINIMKNKRDIIRKDKLLEKIKEKDELIKEETAKLLENERLLKEQKDKIKQEKLIEKEQLLNEIKEKKLKLKEDKKKEKEEEKLRLLNEIKEKKLKLKDDKKKEKEEEKLKMKNDKIIEKERLLSEIKEQKLKIDIDGRAHDCKLY